MTAATLNTPIMAGSTSQETFRELSAKFWQSPFAISSATIIVSELMLMMGHSFGGLEVSQDVFMALTFLAATMFTAGTLPAWNCLKLDAKGLDQHGGLTHFHVDWDQVKSVAAVPGGVRISYVDTVHDCPVFRQSFVQNRYDVSGNEFRRMIEELWLEQAKLEA